MTRKQQAPQHVTVDTAVTIDIAESVQRTITFQLSPAQRTAIEKAGYDPSRPLDVQTYFMFFTDEDTLADLVAVAGEEETRVIHRYADKVTVREVVKA